MRTVQLEYLRPDEIAAEKERCPIVYLPLGPLEWHGPAMPFGTDPLVAQAIARKAAAITGGVVMPTLYVGTERERPAFMLEAKGFENAKDMYVWGMDVPDVTVNSYYAREDMFAVIVREHLRLLVQQGYKLIVVVNGHGAMGQKSTLDRLAVEFSNETDSKVIVNMPTIDTDKLDVELDFGHGTLLETSLVRAVCDEHVDLSQLPPRDVPLPYTKYGIADDFVFEGIKSPNNCVVYDPRDATPELGEKALDLALDYLLGLVQEAYAQIKKP